MVRRRKNTQLFSGINIVPFTDVVLVLLIVFMIAAPGLMNTSLGIRLPGSSTAERRSAETVEVGLDASGRVYVKGQVVPRDKLKERINAELASGHGDILLNADEGVKHGEVVALLDLLRSIGGKNVLIGTVRR